VVVTTRSSSKKGRDVGRKARLKIWSEKKKGKKRNRKLSADKGEKWEEKFLSKRSRNQENRTTTNPKPVVE